MNKHEVITEHTVQLDALSFPVSRVHTLVVGSGAASLKAALRLNQLGVEDLLIVTESVQGGTSYNTGSDKQTYYRLSTNSKEPDSPYMMAHDLYKGGAMHGDLALVEAMLSSESFYYLCSLGVPFPIHKYGGYVGYKTDHDSRERGCSIGPYTSKKMVEVLLSEVRQRSIPLQEHIEIISLLRKDDRIVGAIAIDKKRLTDDTYGICLYMADNVVFGVGGPGGIYEDSVYPGCHNGAIGLALEIGAQANNLTESQFGLASTKFRWNVSGSYQQVIPAYISTDSEGNDVREFLQPFFKSTQELCNAIFLKGYQWPFDVKKILDGGSSLIDILVYRERVLLGRKVFMDFRRNPGAVCSGDSFSLENVGEVARTYLTRSNALSDTPFKRLLQMNPQAIELYRTNGIDLETEPLEVAVCAQHNNGGLSVDIWWESVNIKHLFPVGEVSGTHGIARPGGSALNSGQVGGERAAQKIARVYRDAVLDRQTFDESAREVLPRIHALAKRAILSSDQDSQLANLARYQKEFKKRMSSFGSMIRSKAQLGKELDEAKKQLAQFDAVRIQTPYSLPHFFTVRHLVLTHYIYLSAIMEYMANEGGSRGSALILHSEGEAIHEQLEGFWRYKKEDEEKRNLIMTTCYENKNCVFCHLYCRPIPDDDFWFETVWREFLQGKHLVT